MNDRHDTVRNRGIGRYASIFERSETEQRVRGPSRVSVAAAQAEGGQRLREREAPGRREHAAPQVTHIQYSAAASLRRAATTNGSA